MSTPPTSTSSDSYSVIRNLPTLPTPVSNVPSDAVASIASNSSNPTIICLLRFACDSAAGAFRGSILGYGSGLIKKKGFKGSFSEAGSFAKRFVVSTGLHRLVVCFLKRLRGEDDVINAGVAGCCTGLALSYPGSPQALLQSCLGFGAFSVVIKGLNKQQFALALPDSAFGGKRRHSDVLPPLAIPLPTKLKESFSSVCETLRR